MKTINILIVGVGGQGVIMASDLLAKIGIKEGLDVKKSEIHGMAQRGGSVESHVRIGDKVLAPLIPKGAADFMISVEQVEALRHLDDISKDSTILVSTFRAIPPSVTVGGETYPETDKIEAELKRHSNHVAMIDVPSLMRKVGNPRVANIILLGAMSVFMPFSAAKWLEVIEESMPAKILEINKTAFSVGREAGEKIKSGF